MLPFAPALMRSTAICGNWHCRTCGGVAGCFVALNDERAITGFYTLAATSVAVNALPSDLTQRLPRYPLVPAALIGRLAVAVEYRGAGWVESSSSMPLSAPIASASALSPSSSMQKMIVS